MTTIRERSAFSPLEAREVKGWTGLTLPALTRLANLKRGRLDITLPDGREFTVEGEEAGPQGALTVHRRRTFRRALLRGDVGLGEAFMDGDWETPDLAGLLGVFAAQADTEGGNFAPKRHSRILLSLAHLLRANTRAGARRNIRAHYDLGNAFYAEWLDPTMTYSAALFEGEDLELEDAQAAKYRSLISRTGIEADHHVLEVGCGWGGFACLAAKETGCRVTCLTLSPSQKEVAERRVQNEGLGDRVVVELTDYRDVRGMFDRIVSIEMFEAVGERYWGTYFDALSKRLKPGGKAGLQIITIRDDLFAAYRRTADFLQTYIFPGGMLPPSGRLETFGAEVGLHADTPKRFGQDYARTLSVWHERFERAWPRLAAMGFDERFRRMWRFYLASCEAGFRHGLVDVEQVVYAKP